MNSDNSDEELDYEDDVMDEDAGSMEFGYPGHHQQIERVVEPHEQASPEMIVGNRNRRHGDSSEEEEATADNENNLNGSIDNGIALGGTSNNMLDEEMVMNNPHLKRLLSKMLDKKIKQAQTTGESSGSELLSCMTPQDKRQSTNNTGNKPIKSPSDTTIYVPALNRARELAMRNRERNDIPGLTQQDVEIALQSTKDVNKNANVPQQDENAEVITRISDFVGQIRLKQREAESTRSPDDNNRGHLKSSVKAPGYDEAHKRMENALIESEKFRAEVETPPGTNFINTSPPLLNVEVEPRCVIGNGLTDDDFFHLTCHIDTSLKRKIENGEYVDLDKLIQKESNIFNPRSNMTNETKLEWVQSEGSTYLVPAKNTSKINCFRCWEQAFRIYVTIYCTKNPERAREVWQYVSVINTASMSYNWDNVYNYDIVFRQLMEFNPNRSWGVTYNQMWNLSMTTPLGGQSGNSQRRSFGNTNQTGYTLGGQNSSGPSKRKIDYCW